MSRVEDLDGQMFDQEFALNLATFFVFHCKCCQASPVNRILAGVAITAVLLSIGYGFLGNPEEMRQRSGETVYRGPGGNAAEMAWPTRVPQKVPGESKKS
jgi:hypothetical protein